MLRPLSTLILPGDAMRDSKGWVFLDCRRQYTGGNIAVLSVYAKRPAMSPNKFTGLGPHWAVIYAEPYKYTSTKELPAIMRSLVNTVEIANGVRVKLRSSKQFALNNTGEPS